MSCVTVTPFYVLGEAGKGGACTAAAFLKAFVDEERAWAHIDIAGPGMQSKVCECVWNVRE